MSPEAILNGIIGLLGVVAGAVGAIIAIRKMPAEVGQTQSSTMRNLLETTRMLSADNRDLHSKIEELENVLHGEFEIVTHVAFANPPRVITSTIRTVIPIESAEAKE